VAKKIPFTFSFLSSTKDVCSSISLKDTCVVITQPEKKTIIYLLIWPLQQSNIVTHRCSLSLLWTIANVPAWRTIRRPADTQAIRLRSASSKSLYVRHTRLSTVGDRAFPVPAARLWNSLSSHVTAAPLSPISVFCCRLKSHLFSDSYPAFWLFSHLYSARAVTRRFGRYNRYYILHLTF